MGALLPAIDAFSGVREDYRYDRETKSLVTKRTQHVADIIDFNAALRNENSQAWRKDPERWMLFARIPNIVIEAWLKEGIDVYNAAYDRRGVPNEHMVRVLRKLRDPEWAYLKTTRMDMGIGR